MGIVEATYAEIKQQELKKNPYSCLSTADIDVNPHQVEAFTFSLAAMKLGGAILADEVGLGKWFEYSRNRTWVFANWRILRRRGTDSICVPDI